MAVDDEILWRNPFTFEMKEALLNDSVKRETLMNKKIYEVCEKYIAHIIYMSYTIFIKRKG